MKDITSFGSIILVRLVPRLAVWKCQSEILWISEQLEHQDGKKKCSFPSFMPNMRFKHRILFSVLNIFLLGKTVHHTTMVC